MRAWIVDAPGGAGPRLGEMPEPAPAAGEVRVEVRAAGLNFSDLLMAAGTYQVRPPPPFVAGQEIAGIVREASPGSRWRPGDAVAGKVSWGAFAERAVARDDMLFRVPAGLSLAAAATLPVVWPTAWIGLFDRAGLRAGEKVLVHAAAGGVGSAAVQLAAAAGANVVAGVGDAGKAAVALACGAQHVVDTRADGWADRAAQLLGGRADVVFDPVGGPLVEGSLRCLARRGRYLVVGFAGGLAPLPAHRLLLKSASALGVYWSHDEDGALLERALADILALREAGRIRVEAARRYPFEDLVAAYGDLAARRTTGKCVLSMEEAA